SELRSCGLRTSPMRQDGSSVKPSAADSTRMPGRSPDSGNTETASPDNTAAQIALALPLEYKTRYGRPIASRQSTAARRERQALLDVRRMTVRCRPQQSLLAEIFRRHAAGAIGDDRKIDLVALDTLEQTDGLFADDGQLDRRIGAREARHDLGEIAV